MISERSTTRLWRSWGDVAVFLLDVEIGAMLEWSTLVAWMTYASMPCGSRLSRHGRMLLREPDSIIYQRNGTTALLSALKVVDGKVIGHCMQRHRHQEFIRFLNTIEYPFDPESAPRKRCIFATL
jgi:hypothetical protein